ncbi:oligosaccharide flippase family protein [Algoriphagus sp. SE2]|uniref:oligosaccharide flippase family protein n=1 Tax=Algoriphagus sp. SE2 TaxID=3141536 RepID=UPI0031CD2745
MISKIKSRIKGLDVNTKEVVNKSGWSMIVKIVGLIAGFLVSIFLGRTLGAEGLGVLNLSTKIIGVIMVFSLLGINTVVLKNISISFENKNWNEVANTIFSAFWITFPISILFSILLFSISPWLSISVFQEPELYIPLAIASIALIFQVQSRIFSSGINGFRKIWQSNLTNDTLSYGVILIGLILFYFFDIQISLVNVAILYGVSRLIVLLTVGTYWRTIFHFKGKRSFLGTPMLKVGLPLLLVSAGSLISSNADAVMLGWLSSAKEVGFYSVAAKLGLMTSFFHMVTVSTLSPKIASLYQLDKIKELELMVQKVTKVLIFIGLASVFVFIVFGKFVLNLWGSEFQTAYIPLIIITIGQLFNIGTGATGIILIMTGFEKIVGRIVLIFALLNLVLNYLLIPMYGAIGAALATAITLAFENILKYFLLKMKLSINTIKLN